MIKYQNSKGEAIRLDAEGFYADEGTLRSFVWEYNYTPFPDGSGGAVSRFTRNEMTRTFTVSAHAYSSEQLMALLNRLHNITEYDIRERTPGKLWIDNQYIVCYLISSEITSKSRRVHFVTKELNILPTIPFWCMEETKNFLIGGNSTVSSDAKRYNGRYPTRYGTGYSQAMLDNTVGNWQTPMIITIYGAAVDPSINIGSHLYTLNTTLQANERAVIDQLNKKIYKIGTTGLKTNLFNSRDKTTYIFQYAPVGMVPVFYNGDYSFDITLVHQRSEPLWI
jgi:hypothetical protein